MVTDPTSTTALPARPMNAEPFNYPTATFASLSDDARTVYGRALRSQKVDRDFLDPRSAHAWVNDTDGKAFQPSEAMLAAIAELEAVGLATYKPDYQGLYATRVHPLYTVAYGRGSQLIRVSIVDNGRHPGEPALLAVLVGGDLETKSGNAAFPEIIVRSRHENATDFEHDSSSTAYLVVRNPGPTSFGGRGRVEVSGVLVDARLYPLGVDPLTVSDRDTTAGKVCDYKWCEKPHPFAPGYPPKLSGLATPQFVVIETFPYRPYQVADLAANIATATMPDQEDED